MTDSILKSYYNVTSSTFVPFVLPEPEEGALALLLGEEGFAVDATGYDDITAAAYLGDAVGGTVAVRSTGDPTDNLSNVAMHKSNLVQSGTSAKVVQFPTSPYARWSAHNLGQDSQVFNSWSNIFHVAITDNNTVAPDGTTTGALWTVSITGEAFAGDNIAIAAGTYTASVYAKAGTTSWIAVGMAAFDGKFAYNFFNVSAGTVGSPSISWAGGSVVSASIEDAGGGWWRCQTTIITANAGGLIIYLAEADNDIIWPGTGSTAYLWGAQLNRGYPATPYLVTTSAARYGIPQSYDAAAGQYGILVEPAATNLALQSNDFTNASWTKSNMTTAKTAVGPDGVTNSASTLTASAGNATALQAITSASSQRITGVWIKRNTGSGNIDLTQDNGSTWQTMTVTSDWTRVSLTAASLTNPTVGIRIVTSADSVHVWGFQHETGTILTSTIPTTTATVTRAVDVLSGSMTTIPYSTTAGTLGLSFKTFKASAYDLAYWGTGTNGTPHIAHTSGTFKGTIWGNSWEITMANPSIDVVHPVKFAFATGNNAARLDTTTTTSTDAHSPALASNSPWSIGKDITGNVCHAWIYKVVYMPRRVTDGDLPTWSFT